MQLTALSSLAIQHKLVEEGQKKGGDTVDLGLLQEAEATQQSPDLSAPPLFTSCRPARLSGLQNGDEKDFIFARVVIRIE